MLNHQKLSLWFFSYLNQRFFKSPLMIVAGLLFSSRYFFDQSKNLFSEVVMFAGLIVVMVTLRYFEDLLDSEYDRKWRPDRINPLDRPWPDIYLILSILFCLSGLSIWIISREFFPLGLFFGYILLSFGIFKFLYRRIWSVFILLKYSVLFAILVQKSVPFYIYGLFFILAFIYEMISDKNFLKIISFFVLFGLFPKKGFAEFSISNDLQLTTTYREYLLSSNRTYNTTTDLLFRYQFNLEQQIEGFNWALTPELKSLASPALSLEPTDPAFVSLHSNREINRTEGLIQSSEHNQTFVDIHRLYFEMTLDQVELMVGRRPLGLGQLKYFSIWNKFSPNIFSELSDSSFANPDYGLIKLYFGDTTLTAFHVAGRIVEDSSSVFIARTVISSVEAQMLLAQWWNRQALGATGTLDLDGAAIRLEILHLLPFDTIESETQFAAGYDQALTEKLGLTFEYLYFTSKKNIAEKYQSRFHPFLNHSYLFSAIDYNLTQRWLGQGGLLINTDDQSFLALAKLIYGYSENLEFTLQSFIPSGGENVEFGYKTVSFAEEETIGPALPISFNIKYNF